MLRKTDKKFFGLPGRYIAVFNFQNDGTKPAEVFHNFEEIRDIENFILAAILDYTDAIGVKPQDYLKKLMTEADWLECNGVLKEHSGFRKE